ncbi:hypothetical protein Poli38472_004358 [Pythium oligandrum]|uniref:Uncharacterized protein n=1 Tax=Pythium oligandrum TaxID=41045 RepID=A0A8K1C9P1_PYTOL|nr:hypothetical protein Poli38472_004358 [Pythium oligandrum]|eukprot:TMW59289.1 hypothetical protein Poli38472_004358 [Pythium oligandrum]
MATASSDGDVAASKPRQRNSTRDREKAELVALRRLVRELETHVMSLIRSGENKDTRDKMAATWQRLAHRQARSRRASEQRNRDLYDRVRRNADWIQRLWELLSETRRVEHPLTLRLQWSPLDETHTFERLKQDVAHAAAVDGLQGFSHEEEDVWMRLKSEFRCVRHVPFDRISTTQALWASLTSLSGCDEAVGEHPNAFKARLVERTHQACAMKYPVLLEQLDKPVLASRFAVARHEDKTAEGQGAMMVWRSISFMNEDHIGYNDIVWLAVEESPMSPLASRINIVLRSQIDAAFHQKEAALHAVFMAISEACISNMLSTAEGMLLDSKWAEERDETESFLSAVSV